MNLNRPETIDGYTLCCKSCRAWVRAVMKNEDNPLVSRRRRAYEFVTLCSSPDFNCDKD